MFGAWIFCFVVIIYKNRDKKASFEKSLFFIQSHGGALARFWAFVFVAFAFGACRAFLGLLRGCAVAWSVFDFSHFAQIERFDFGVILWYNYIKKGGETVKEAERINAESEGEEMKIEFVSFCRALLLLLKSGQIEESKTMLEKIIEQSEK